MKKQIRCIIHGRVQGVNFRWDGCAEARRLGLTGWIRNRPDETVECLVEGEEEKLHQFVRWCELGPSSAKVEKCSVTWKDWEGERTSFSIER